jgi:hypothetical protein
MQFGAKAKVFLAVAFTATFLPKDRALAEEAPTLAQIIEGIERMEAAFFNSDSFFLRYERSKTQAITPSSSSGGFLLAEWTLASKGGKWFSERRFTQPRKTKEVLIPAKPKTEVLQDKVLLEWDQQFEAAYVQHLVSDSNIYRGLFYTRNLSLDAPMYIAQSRGVSIASLRDIPSLKDELGLPFLPEFLRANIRRYEVLSSQEEVDGVLCWVVQWPGMDRFWVDPNRGFAVPRRQYCFGPGKPLRFEFRNRDYREVKPGLWFPFVQVEDRYASIEREKEALWGKVITRSEYRVKSIEFDNVSDAAFEVKLPPGTRVFDSVRNFDYSVSGPSDSDPFSEAIFAAKKQERWSIILWSSIGIGLVCGVLVTLYIFRARFARNPKTSP